MLTSFVNTIFKRLTTSPAWFLTLFILLNLIFKFYYLPQESIYGDEAYSIFQGQKPLGELTDVFLHDQNPPLHIALLHFWMQLFGISDVSAKSFSVVLSVLCAFVLFIYSKKYLNKTAAIFVSILFLFSNVQLFYSHEIRTYALVQVLCMSSFYFYFKILKTPDKTSIVMLTLFNLLLLFSHYLTIFIHITQFICVWMFYKENKKGIKYYVVSQLIVMVLFLPWLKVLFANLPQNGSFWLSAPGFGELQWFVFMLNGNEWLFAIFSTIILSSLLMVFLNKRFHFFKQGFDVRIYVLFFTWYVLPIALDFWVAQYTPVFLGRYFLYSSIGLCLLITYIIVNLNTNNFVRNLVFIPIFFSLIYAFDAKPEKEDNWKFIVPLVKKQQDKKTIILISASYKYKEFSFYYDRPAFQDYNNTIERLAKENVFCSPDGPLGWSALNFEQFDQIIYVQSHSQFEDPEGKIKKGIVEKKYKICSEFSIKNVTVTFFKKENMECNSVKIIKEQKMENCDFWKTGIGINEQSGDSVMIYSTGMEPDPGCPLPHSIVTEKARTGLYSCKIYSEDQYSIGLFKTVGQLGRMRQINISAFVYYEPGSNAHLVVSVEKGSQSLFRNELILSEQLPTPNVWGEISLSAIIPADLPDDAEFKIYFWNPADMITFIDDCKIQLNSGL